MFSLQLPLKIEHSPLHSSPLLRSLAALRSRRHSQELALQANVAPPHQGINCATGNFRCLDVYDSDHIFGHYVGHDEPSTLFLLQPTWLG